MVTTLQQAVRPLFLTFHVLGLGIRTPEKPYLSIFYSATLWIIYGYLFYYVVIRFKVEQWFQTTSVLITIQLNSIVSMISIFLSLYNCKVHIYAHTYLI